MEWLSFVAFDHWVYGGVLIYFSGGIQRNWLLCITCTTYDFKDKKITLNWLEISYFIYYVSKKLY